MEAGSVFVIGSHPVRDDIIGQFRRLGREVVVSGDRLDSREAVAGAEFGEWVVLTSPDAPDALQEDGTTIEWLRTMARRMSGQDGIRPLVHLLLQTETALSLLRKMDLPQEINDAFEIRPFTMEDEWARNLFVCLPGAAAFDYPPLDREPITAGSQRFVHLVICGFDAQARTVAAQAALVAHFPNYDGKARNPLRTRITFIEKDIARDRDAFVASFSQLFDHSFYRTIIPDARHSVLHKPMYHGRRTDFVDVEWEFVDAAPSHPEVRRKLRSWACDPNRLLTMVLSGGNDADCLSAALSMPEEVFEREIPVLVRQKRDSLSAIVSNVARYRNVRPFGMMHCGYDVTQPLTEMAKLLKYFYDCSYDERGVPTTLPMSEVEDGWRSERSFAMRYSNICNVMTMPTKMHSLGHDASDADNFYALNRNEIEAMAETEHNRWSVDRLMAGSRPCTDAEREEIARNIAEIIAAREAGHPLPEDRKRFYKKERNVHYDLCAYEELGRDATGKDVKVYDYDLTACIPLIVKTYIDKNRHE